MIRELTEYYDYIANQPDTDFIPDGYTKVNDVAYKLVITRDGKIKDILPNTHTEIRGKKTVDVGNSEIFPFRRSVSGISAETIECREKYMFGMELDKQSGSLQTSKNSLLAFEKNKQKNTEFLNGINTEVAEAYKLFLENWNPEMETENQQLVQLGKLYAGAKFITVVEGFEANSFALHNDLKVKEKWDTIWQERSPDEGATVIGQCSISGKTAPIARIHNNLTGIAGGLATGVNLVCYKTSAFWSYGKEDSYNSSVSVEVMEKYTKVFNYLSSSKIHKRMLDENITLLFWVNTREKEAPYLEDFIYELFDTEEQLDRMAEQIQEGFVGTEKHEFDQNVKFCVLGIKPNTSRLAIKLFETDSFGNIMARIAKHQADMRILADDKPIALWQIVNELKVPNSTSKNKGIPPHLSAKLMTAILKNIPYPEYLLELTVRRAKTDKDNEQTKFRAINKRRVRIIKGCLVRMQYYKGDEYMLDSAQQTNAFRCGRLFAVLEMIQRRALGDVNSTIKDKFFASACATPDLIFARLIKLAQAHLAKLDDRNSVYYDKLLQEIISEIDCFPKTLSLQKQGDFILGYYQQKQKLFEKKDTEAEE